jgi:hypothetical protein
VRLVFVFALALAPVALAFQDDAIAKFGTTVVISSGLRGNIYNLRRNTQRLPDFRKRKPVGTIYTTSLAIPPQDFAQGFPGVTKRFEWFAIDYAGRFWIEKPGEYRFALNSDDGSKLYIDDELVIDNDGQHPPVERDGRAELHRGVHEIRISYFQGPRFHVALVLKVAGPGEPFRVFDTNEFKPPPNPEDWREK